MLRKPLEELQTRQRRNCVLKKAFTQTCTMFAEIGVELMYSSILISDPVRLQKLINVLNGNPNLGWWTRAIYVYIDDRQGSHELNTFISNGGLVSLIERCPNLQILMVDPQINPASFLSVADALRTNCAQSLKMIQWKVAYSSQAKIMPATIGLRNLEALQIEINYPSEELSSTLPGIRKMMGISFPYLRQLQLRGAIQDFVDQVTTWELPELKELTLDFKACRHDFPDVIEVIEPHGIQLEVLDLNAIPTLDVPTILNMCPNLVTFCFNLDWQLEGNLTQRQHQKIRNIGLYGLRHAFGVGFAGEVAQVNPFEAIIMRRRNDVNFVSMKRNNFPNLGLIRVLESGLLNDLNKSNGPAAGVCYERWERWWEQCVSQRVRLEDCTGNLLGTLPSRDDDDDLIDDDSDVTGSQIDAN